MQMRVTAGTGAMAYTGVDMAGVLALARASGVPDALAADMLPDLAGVALRKLNERSHG